MCIRIVTLFEDRKILLTYFRRVVHATVVAQDRKYKELIRLTRCTLW